jgi:hypothetical protein
VSTAFDTPGLSYTNAVAQGSAFSHNAGFSLNLPIQLLPSLNVVARNLGDAKFKSTTLYKFSANASGVPADEPMSLDGALGISPVLGRGAFLNMVLQYRDFLNSSNRPILHRMALGLETSFRNSFFIRGGLSNLWPSAGVGFRRGDTSELSFSWYSEDRARSGDRSREIRYSFQYQVRAHH